MRNMRSLWFVFAVGAAVAGTLYACGGSNSNSANSAPAPVTADVLTWHNDIARTGQNLAESVLTPSSVSSGRFGLQGLWSVDGRVDAQPLYVASAQMADGQAHNVLVVATEHASVYAFDADTGATLWNVSLLGAGETPSDDRGCSQVSPEIGVTSTPVIDRSLDGGVIIAVAMSKNGSQYFQRLHAIRLQTGAERAGSPVVVQAVYPGNGVDSVAGFATFDPKQYKERAGLLLIQGVVITTWASHCDNLPYTGWIIGYDEATLAQRSVLNITPNGSGGSNWASGAAPASDASAIYYLTANGTFDTTLNASGLPISGDYGNAFLKIGLTGGLSVLDYFTMTDTVAESNADEDLGSGGVVVLPDQHDAMGKVRHLALGAGKDSNIYVVDRDAMGGFSTLANNNWQTLAQPQAGGYFSTAAFFNGTVYFGGVSDAVRAFALTNAQLSATPTSQTATVFVYPGATPSISANGTSGAILWAVENSSPAVLHAYDATNLANEFYNSNHAGTRDQFGPGNKFIVPTVVAGKVFVGTPSAVAVFALH